MIVHTFKIRLEKFNKEASKSYSFSDYKDSVKVELSIPKSQTLKFEKIKIHNSHTEEDEEWIEIIVTDWIWRKGNLEKKLKKYIMASDVIINNETHLGIDWDYVIMKRRNIDNCYFCHGKLYDANRTKDHLIPKVVLRAYGYKGEMANNKVPCCKDCNLEKSSLHPEIYREFVKRKISETGNPKYRVIMFTLNKTLKT